MIYLKRFHGHMDFMGCTLKSGQLLNELQNSGKIGFVCPTERNILELCLHNAKSSTFPYL